MEGSNVTEKLPTPGEHQASALLIHLNGAPGSGKSTLATGIASRFPGTLALDLDEITYMIGGWEDSFFKALRVAQNIALPMVNAHLATGQWVVIPQLVTSLEYVKLLEQCATDACARYLEIVLKVDEAVAIRRYRDRMGSVEGWRLARTVERAGGERLIHKVLRDFGEYVEARRDWVAVDASGTAGASLEAALTIIRREVGDSQTPS